MAHKFKANEELCKLVGANLRRLRTNREVTQVEMGKALGMSGNKVISDWEAGKRDITISQLFAVKEFLRIEDWNEFF
jgi:transcriptional regulator with XRE-family HTH domain